MFLELCSLLLIILAYIYVKFTRKFHYWSELRVPSLSQTDQRKNNWDLFMRKRAVHDIKKEEYKKFDGERFYGIFDGARHMLVVRDDFELIKSILVKDFDYFGKAQGALFGDLDPTNRAEQIILKGITVIHGDEWKTVRCCLYI